MTAEIAILNKEAVALAADSAITFTGPAGKKIFSSANKLFSLSKYSPVGVMVYNNALFMGVPWEQVIKIYRKKLGNTKFDTLQEYCDHFIGFLQNNKPLQPSPEQANLAQANLFGLFKYIKDKIGLTIQEEEAKNKKFPGKRRIRELIKETILSIDNHLNQAKQRSNLPDSFGHDILKLYGKHIIDIRKRILEQLPITQSLEKIIANIAVNFFSSTAFNNSAFTGIVIAGFGEEDIFPSLSSYIIHGVVANTLLCMEERSIKITHSNPAVIAPFAQNEMVISFMEGVDPNYQRLIEESLQLILKRLPAEIVDGLDKLSADEKAEYKRRFFEISNKRLVEYLQNLNKHRKENFSSPIVSIVTALPKDELAAMAESLVNLTAFKRRVSPGDETVGEPIDVAVISKGDGLIWIKRKHYFSKDHNYQFFSNYYREG